MVSSIKPFVMRREDGDRLAGPVGGAALIKATTASTAGSIALVDNVVGPKMGPPLHLHRREDEMWFIVEGNFRFLADDVILDAPEGSFVFVPRNTTHCFQNIDETPSRVLVLFTPSGMERFFIEHAELPPGVVDPAAYDRIAERSFMEVSGPPLSVSHPV
ncbi:MAG: cupin domain-containing protein [Acidimicrobiia bacterium]|nr:cupin domain-containing protein [Acidimicrobiia bacterium]